MAYDDRYCMLTLNDVSRDSKVDLASPGVVTLDTTVVPDVRVLPGEFLNTVRVLVPDVNDPSLRPNE